MTPLGQIVTFLVMLLTLCTTVEPSCVGKFRVFNYDRHCGPFWRQMLADIFCKPVVTLETQEGSAYGAALLAQVGTGVYDTVPDACRATVRETEWLESRCHEAQQYARGHEIYKALYPTLKPIFRLIQNSN